MRRAAVGVGGLVLLLVAWAFYRPARVSREADGVRPAPRAPEVVRTPPEALVGREGGEAVVSEPERPGQPYDRVVQACGFDVEERCVETGCGAVVSMPDLDRLDGWVRLLWSQPWVVSSTAARDLGLPVAWTPCGDALMASPEVMAAQVGPFRELWCVGDRSACDAAAAERHGWTGFAGGVRLTRRVFSLD